MMDPITLLVVDTQLIVCQGVRAVVRSRSDIEIVGETNSGEDAIQIAQYTAPDVILIDVNLRGSFNSIETTRRLKQLSPHSNIVGMGSGDQEEPVFAMLRAGALAYMLKNIRAAELISTLHSVARGEALLDQWAASQLLNEASRDRGERNTVPFAFSEIEIDILKLIAQGCTRFQISQHMFVSEKVVRGHVSNALGKLQQAERTESALCDRRTRLRNEFFVQHTR